MPGIVGIIRRTNDTTNKDDVRVMVNCMKHESCYGEGIYHNEQLGFYSGWVCHKNSFSEGMPIVNDRGDMILIFSGEHFPNIDSTDRFKQRRHTCDLLDASSLIQLYEEKGEGFLRELNGWFGGVIIDLRKQKIILFNDRYSMHRIYYYQSRDAFYFSSEAKSILRVLAEPRRIDALSAAEYLLCGCTLENRSLFSNIKILPGGSAWTFHNDGRIDKESYFDFAEWEEQDIFDDAVFYDRFYEVFREVVPAYFRSKSRVAMSLTGGLDTRMIMASANPAPESLHCYTFSGTFRDCYDVRIAREVALTCRQPYSVFKLDSAFLKDFPRHAERTIFITDGCVDVSVSHEIYVNGLARTIAPIRMTGNYGSEVLRSVNYIRAVPPVNGLIHPDFQPHIQNAVDNFYASKKDHKLTYAVTKLIPWHLYGRLSAAQSQLTVRTPYMDNAIVRLFYQASENVRKDNGISRRLIRDSNTRLAAIRTDRGVSIEECGSLSRIVRIYREILFRAEYLYNEGTPDWMGRCDRLVRPLHPERVFLGHHKIEHYRHWFCTDLAEYMRNIITDSRTLSRPYWDGKFLKKMVDDHIKGKRNHIREINRVIGLELIHRTLLENI